MSIPTPPPNEKDCERDMSPKIKHRDRKFVLPQLHDDAESAEAEAAYLLSFVDEDEETFGNDEDDVDITDEVTEGEDPDEDDLDVTGDDFFDDESFTQAVEAELEADRRDRIIGGYNVDTEAGFNTPEDYMSAVDQLGALSDEEQARVQSHAQLLFVREIEREKFATELALGLDVTPIFDSLRYGPLVG